MGALTQLQRAMGNRGLGRLLDGQATPASQAAVSSVPPALRHVVETLSGLDLSDVRVHYASGRPLASGASALASGADIHLGPGAERHLPHELWHIVQQRVHSVPATARIDGHAFNLDPRWEAEADGMARLIRDVGSADLTRRAPMAGRSAPSCRSEPVVQGMMLPPHVIQSMITWSAFTSLRDIPSPVLLALIKAIEQSGGSNPDLPHLRDEFVRRQDAVDRERARRRDFSGPTVGVEQEIACAAKVQLQSRNAGGRIGQVSRHGEVLVEFWTDMSGSVADNIFTIELKTTPAVLNNQRAQSYRMQAMSIMLGAIMRAAGRHASGQGGSVVSGIFGDYKLEVLNRRHWVIPNSDDWTLRNQASVGVPIDTLLRAVGPTMQLQPTNDATVDLIVKHAPWLADEHLAGIAQEWTARGPNSHTLAEPEKAFAVFALIAMVIRYLARVVNENSEFVKIKKKAPDSEGRTPGIEDDLYNPFLKEKWVVLPRTPALEWTDTLSVQDREFVKTALETTYSKRGDFLHAALNHVLENKYLTGHSIAKSRINGAPSAVFEFRSMAQELTQYTFDTVTSGMPAELSPEATAREAEGDGKSEPMSQPNHALTEFLKKIEKSWKNFHPNADSNPPADDDPEWK